MNFQVYKISNVNLEKKAIYLAKSSLYILLQNEAAIFATFNILDAAKCERKFNDMVSSAVKDYPAYLSTAYEDEFKIEIMTNFIDFFNVCADAKKSQAEENQGTSVEQQNQVPSAEQQNEVENIPAKITKRR